MLGTSKFQSEQTINTVNKCDKNCYCRPDSLDKSTSQFKKPSKALKIQTGFRWESKILLYLICRGCKVEYIDESRCMLKERLDPIKCWGINLTPPVVFPKMYLLERGWSSAFLWLLVLPKVTLVLKISFKIPQVLQKIWRFSLSILTIFINCWIFWHFLVTKNLMTLAYNMISSFFPFQPTLSRFNNCVKLY